VDLRRGRVVVHGAALVRVLVLSTFFSFLQHYVNYFLLLKIIIEKCVLFRCARPDPNEQPPKIYQFRVLDPTQKDTNGYKLYLKWLVKWTNNPHHAFTQYCMIAVPAACLPVLFYESETVIN
jgi:hypothetical protein